MSISTQLSSSGQVRLLLNNTTANAAALAEGRTLSSLIPSDTNGIFSIGPVTGQRHRGTEITFFGAGSATQTLNYKVWGIKACVNSSSTAEVVDYERVLLCTGLATLGTQAGVGGATSRTVRTTDLIADTITVTNSAYCVGMAAQYQAPVPAAYSNGSNQTARLFIPDLGNVCAIQVEIWTGTATSGNALVERVI